MTPAVSYTYDDANVPNSKGKLMKVASSISETRYTKFDLLGRVEESEQRTPFGTETVAQATARVSKYKYNLSGALVEQTYPSTRVVKNVLDNDGMLSIVQSKKNANAGYWNYAQHFTYMASGAVSSMQLGNGKWESTAFNSRLQPTQIALGTVQGGTDKLKLDYEYNTLGQTDNNGNVLKQTITVQAVGQTPGFEAVQNYTYDNLNRLKSATENLTPTGGTSYQSWKQTFNYDRYGNRNFDTANTDTLGSCSQAVCNPTVDASNNRFTSGQGYTYDLSGNVVTDAQGRSFTFDAENKQTKVVNSGQQTVGEYFYDGDGKRVKKIAGNETTIFVYDAMGKLVAEYSNQTQQATPQVSYLTNDHLGSPRITTDKNGNVYSRRDFMPFGEEISSTDTAERNVNLNYGEDGIRRKFTSYERDNETELDFAQARMYANRLGRFTTPDPHKIVLETSLEEDEEKAEKRLRSYIGKPEQWNKYTYVINNPLKFVDPDGREIRLDKNLTEKERNEILYHLQKLTRDNLSWKTDKNGNVVIVATKIKGANGKNNGTRLLRRMIGYNSVITIKMTTGGNSGSIDNLKNASNGVGSNSTVYFNPNSNINLGTLDENTGISRSQDRPAWIGLAHELIHSDHAARGTMHKYVDPKIYSNLALGSYKYKDTSGKTQTAYEQRRELAAVGIGGYNNTMDITENQIRKEQGLRIRAQY